ncbi:MAG: phosphatidate cytidylyltransferase [Firmicutes bacterium]|nr:phosphatidate cytidylyltransferase [Bacillota bacterium]
MSSALLQRVVTALVGIPLLLFLVYWDGFPFFLLVFAVGMIALYEYARLWCNKGINCIDPVLYLAGAGIIILTWLGYAAHSLTLIFAAMVTGFVYHGLQDSWRKGNSFLAIGMTVVGLIYIAWPVSLLFLLREQGYELVLFVLILAFGSDTAAYFVGMNFGSRRLAPTISPKKSWEGALGALVFTGLLGAIWAVVVPGDFTLFSGFVFGVVASFLGQIGDLMESMVKRYCGVKDSGSLLPGHGGILDRLDSILVIIPLVYLASLV